jgi:galactokinase
MVQLHQGRVGPVWLACFLGKFLQVELMCCNAADDAVPAFDMAVVTCVPIGGGLSSSAALEVLHGSIKEKLFKLFVAMIGVGRWQHTLFWSWLAGLAT